MHVHAHMCTHTYPPDKGYVSEPGSMNWIEKRELVGLCLWFRLGGSRVAGAWKEVVFFPPRPPPPCICLAPVPKVRDERKEACSSGVTLLLHSINFLILEMKES